MPAFITGRIKRIKKAGQAMRNRIDVYNKCDDSEYRQKKDEVIEKC